MQTTLKLNRDYCEEIKEDPGGKSMYTQMETRVGVYCRELNIRLPIECSVLQ